MPKGKPWAVHRARAGDLLCQARRARTAGADIVIAAVHAGTYSTRENGVGNAVAQHATNVPRGHEGATGRFTFTRAGNGRFTVSKAEYIPTLVTRYQPGRPVRLYQISTALKSAEAPFRDRLLDAQRRISATVMRSRKG